MFQPLKRYTEKFSCPYVSGVWVTRKWRRFAVKTRQAIIFSLRTFVFVFCVCVCVYWDAHSAGNDSRQLIVCILFIVTIKLQIWFGCVQNFEFDFCVTVHHWYNNINSQLDAIMINFIDNYNQLNMFRAII